MVYIPMSFTAAVVFNVIVYCAVRLMILKFIIMTNCSFIRHILLHEWVLCRIHDNEQHGAGILLYTKLYSLCFFYTADRAMLALIGHE